MENTYIVAFTPGTSGRLIANLVWAMLTGINYTYKLTDFNSTHNFTPFARSYDISNLPKTNRLFFHKSPDVYKYLNFTSIPGVFITHIFPDFNTIRERFPNTKLIIITWTKENYDEITGNIVFKNMVEDFIKGKHNPLFQTLVQKVKNQSLENLNLDLLTIEDYKKMCEIEGTRTKSEHFNSDFMNPIIPKDFINKTLLIKYNTICNNTNCTRKMIEDFVGKSFTDNTKILYDEYLIGREKFLAKYLSWLSLYQR